MIKIRQFCCNPYEERAYLISDGTGAGAVIDPGFLGEAETAAFDACLDDDYRKTGILEGFVFDKAEGNNLYFAASVCHPQTDEYIPLQVTLTNFNELHITRDNEE